MAKSAPKCETCDGTGKLVLLRRMYVTDGFTSCRCGICSGSGSSSYRDASYATSQRRLRYLKAKAEDCARQPARPIRSE